MTDRNYGAIRDAAKLDAFVDRIIEQGKPIGFDIEAGYTGPDKEGVALLQFHPDWILVGFSFTNSTEWARYVPIAHDDGSNIDDVYRAGKALWRLLQTGLGVAHNLSYELKGISRWFRELYWDDEEIGAQIRETMGFFPFRSDTMEEVHLVAKYDPLRVGKDLKSVTNAVYDHQMVKFLDLFPATDSEMGPATPKGKLKYVRFNTRNSNSSIVVNYACEDALWCLALHQEHWVLPEIAEGKNLIFRTEMSLLPVLVEMEMEALLLDWPEISRKAKEVSEFKDLKNEEILEELSERLGRAININLGSVPKLSEVLYEPAPVGLGLPIKERSEKTNKPSTSESALRAIAKIDPVIRSILQWRELLKLYGSYLHKYEAELNYAGNGRAYPNHNQAGALTGRLSVDGVSYQQWPKPYHYELNSGLTYDLNFRDLLISPPDHRIVGYDFSQVELRVLAGMANEKALLAAFEADVDIHKATAANMFGIPLDQVTKKIRSQGKTLNFAVVYGSGPGNIAEMLTSPEAPVTKEDAIELLAKYFEAFPGLKNWMDGKVAEGREQGYVHTLFGRKFTVWEYRDHRDWVRSKGDRMCVNAPVQGGAADYMKIGMVRVSKAIKKAEADGIIPKNGIKLFMTVHDALEFYVHDSVSTQTVIDIVQPAVSFPVKGLPYIRADWHEGLKWGSVVEVKLDAEKKISHYELEDVDEEFATLVEAYAHQDKQRADDEAARIKKLAEHVPPAPKPAPEEAPEKLFRTSVIEGVPDEHMEKLIQAAMEPDADTPDEEVKIEIERRRVESLAPVGDMMDLATEPPKGWNTRPEDVPEPEWAHSDSAPMALSQPEVPQQIVITTSEMPTEAQWESFEAYLIGRDGTSTLTVVFPEGPLTLDKKYDLTAEDQPMISLKLGGASLAFGAETVDPDVTMAGMEL